MEILFILFLIIAFIALMNGSNRSGGVPNRSGANIKQYPEGRQLKRPKVAPAQQKPSKGKSSSP